MFSTRTTASRNRAVAIFALIAGVAIFAGCGSDQNTTAANGQRADTAPTQGAAPGPGGGGATSGGAQQRAGGDPCGLLTDSEVAQAGLAGAKSRPIGPQGSACGWTSPNGQLVAAVTKGSVERAEKAIGAGKSEPVTVAGEKGRRVDVKGGCGVLFNVSENATLALIAATSGKSDQGCAIAEQAASVALPRLR